MFLLIFSLAWLAVIGATAAAAWVEYWLADSPAVAETTLHPATVPIASAA